MGIDYSKLALPKTGETPKKRRARRRRAALKVAGVDRDTRVMNRHGGRCVAWGISPVCTGKAQDPHELIPVGAGGERISRNRVPICRACHQAGQGAVGGNRLKFDWPGKADGAKPNADKPGNVKCFWKGKTHEGDQFETTVGHPNGPGGKATGNTASFVRGPGSKEPPR